MEATTNRRRRNVKIAILAICLIITLVCLAVAILRGDREGATLIFLSAGLTARSLAFGLI